MDFLCSIPNWSNWCNKLMDKCNYFACGYLPLVKTDFAYIDMKFKANRQDK